MGPDLRKWQGAPDGCVTPLFSTILFSLSQPLKLHQISARKLDFSTSNWLYAPDTDWCLFSLRTATSTDVETRWAVLSRILAMRYRWSAMSIIWCRITGKRSSSLNRWCLWSTYMSVFTCQTHVISHAARNYYRFLYLHCVSKKRPNFEMV